VDIFARGAPHLDSKLVVFRAQRDGLPGYLQVDTHMGWQPLAKQVVAHAVDATHLEVVRPPHVAEVARAILAELG
jgi:thioesterase domain-containing protein